jgi:hypothetical protein
MITPSDTPAYKHAICNSDHDPMLKKGHIYQIMSWHKDKVCVLADGHTHWTKSSQFIPTNNF